MKISELRELARLYSIQVSYRDAAGWRVDASRETLERAVRVRVGESRSLAEAREARVAEVDGRVVEPVTVAWDGWVDHGEQEYAITLEDGRVLEGWGAVVVPAGYHRMTVGKAHETLVIAAPRKAWRIDSKTWGTFVPLYAVGRGEIADLERWRMGGGVVATLPLLAGVEGERSPYSPSSRLFWNEQYEGGGTDDVPDDFAENAKEYARFAAGKSGKSEREHVLAQYRMARRMREAADEAKRNGVGLYLDFPLGVNPDGYDVWRYGDQFVKGVSVGAPPDAFFTKGQNWGFPPLDPDRIRETGHEYFRACIRHHVEHAGILRIDHVMGLHRLFWIPEGAEAKDGVYVRYPEEELYAILCLESHRAKCAIVGEDLGTVPEYVPRMMAKHGFRRMYVVQYEARPDADQPIPDPPAASVASVNTHDMPTFAGFWEGKDIDDRVEQGLLDEAGAQDEREKREQTREALIAFLKARGLLRDGVETIAVLEAVLAFLSSSDAEIVLVNPEDLWLEREPQNVPGVPERSWKRRFRLSAEEARESEDVIRILRTVSERRKVHGDQTEKG